MFSSYSHLKHSHFTSHSYHTSRFLHPSHQSHCVSLPFNHSNNTPSKPSLIYYQQNPNLHFNGKEKRSSCHQHNFHSSEEQTFSLLSLAQLSLRLASLCNQTAIYVLTSVAMATAARIIMYK